MRVKVSLPILLLGILFVTCQTTENSPNSHRLPSFLKVCRRNDPKLGKCVMRSVQQLKPYLVEGIPEFDIPELEPLLIPRLSIDQGTGGGVFVKSTFTDIKVYGPSDFSLKSVKIDLKKNRVKIKLTIPKLSVMSQYDMSGRILMMPISGKGQSTGNYTNIDATVRIQAERVERDGSTYLHITEFYVDFLLGHASIRLDNLFNGDKKLGETMNTFLNENWKNVTGEIKPVLEDTIAAIFKKFANKIFEKYPLDVILPE